MTTQPLYWLKQINDELQLSKKIPLWGSPPSFPWTLFSKELETYLQTDDVQITLEKKELLSKEDFLTPFGNDPCIRTLTISPLAGKVSLVLSKESLTKMTTQLLSADPHTKNLGDFDLQEGFYQYLLLRTTECFEKLQVYHGLTIQWLERPLLPETSSFVCDLSIDLKGCPFLARLIFSPEFHKSFALHFEKTAPDPLSSPLVNTIDLFLKVEAGSCSLSQKEWKSLKIGDFLILDTCSYDPSLRKGTLQLTLKDTPLFKVKTKKNTLKILDYCAQSGDENMMDDDMNLESFDEEIPFDEELELESELDSELELAAEPEEKPNLLDSLSSPLDILFPIVVEIDRIKMSLEKLLELEPGNIIDLSVHPEQGVYLTVHGKKIAKGELVKIGDAIGVKIVELGETSKL